jgi:hypothetical protein
MVGERNKKNGKAMLGKRSEGDKRKKRIKECNKNMIFLVTVKVLCASFEIMNQQLSQIFEAH